MRVLALELLRSRKAVTRLYTSKAQMNSVSMHLTENLGARAHKAACSPLTRAQPSPKRWATCRRAGR